jgi:hypothetical protein
MPEAPRPRARAELLIVSSGALVAEPERLGDLAQ